MTEILNFGLEDAIYINGLPKNRAINNLDKRRKNNTYGGIDYRPASPLIKKFIDGEKTEQECFDHCDSFKNPLNSQINKEVVALGLSHFSQDIPDHTFKIDNVNWGLRKDVFIKCAIPFGYTQEGKIVLFVPQYRKASWVLDDAGLLLRASVIHHVFAKDDYAGAAVKVANFSDREEDVRVYSVDQLIPESLLYAQFQPFLDAWDELRSSSGPSSEIPVFIS